MNKVWPIDETIECQQITNEYLDQVLELMEKSFFAHENVCKALGIPSDPEALSNLGQVTKEAIKDGISVVAIDKKTSQVVGAAINKIQVKGNTDLEYFIKNWKNKKSIAITALIAEFESTNNLFEKYGVDCIMELLFLSTSSNYRGKGIGKKLGEISIEIGSNLSKGINVKKSIDGQPLPLKETPKLITSIFTTFITQKIGKDLGFQKVAEKSFDEILLDGKPGFSVADDGTMKITLEYRWL